ncbi:hypothetical protein GIB67_021224 [Kingdonia uniflora]|uniref:Uncharacterized protein n=1 Tax=Kingdonia uniflora TaxID=39325 RepID=A0A7J7LFS1_9MAGN|nr:hypothetical protein GIB67_021224 [Kingdonia uniflora]
MTKPTPEEGPSNYQEQVDSKATLALLNNEDALIYVDHATPNHGNAEARGRSASPDNMVEDVERDCALINYEEVRNKSGKNKQVHLMRNAKKKNVRSGVGGYPNTRLSGKKKNLNLNEVDILEYPRIRNQWCLWKFGFNAPVLVAACSQHLTISYDGLLLSAIHGLAFISARRAMWTDMESIANLNLPWLAIGDFNCIRS